MAAGFQNSHPGIVLSNKRKEKNPSSSFSVMTGSAVHLSTHRAVKMDKIRVNKLSN